jgi:hypothetical protein
VKNIFKKSDYEFKISFSDLPDELDLNFQPVIEFFNLNLFYEKFVLCHWQSRPKGLRGFGWYDFLTKQYYSIDWNNIQVLASKSIPIQVNELKLTTALPSAVILYPDSYLMKKGSIWKVLDE